MTDRPAKTPANSESFIAEIVGQESLVGQRMTAGKLLHMMDFAAASAATKHSEGPLVTLAFDRVELLDYIRHMDYVRYNSYVIKVGRSSIVVKVDGFVKSPIAMEIKPVHSGVITMVATDENGRPNRNIPALVYESTKDLERKKMVLERDIRQHRRQEENAAIDKLETVELGWLEDHYPRKKFFSPSETGLTIRTRLLPRNTNRIGIIFGGDTLEMMEGLALATARQFTGNFRMVTIAMEDVLFLNPLKLDNLVEMQSKVTFVARTTLVVEITVIAIDYYAPHRRHVTNKGEFTVLNYDSSGKKRRITSGLDMKHANLEQRKNYLKELIKYETRMKKKK